MTHAQAQIPTLSAVGKTSTNLEFGAYVKKARRSHLPRWSQEDVARAVREQIGGKHANFHRNSVSNLEAGKPVENGTAAAVLQVLGLPPLAESRVYVGQALLVREIVTQWFLSAPDTDGDRERAVQLFVEFINRHPRGGSLR